MTKEEADRLAEGDQVKSRDLRGAVVEATAYKTTFSRELWTSRTPLYSMNPSLRNLFMNTRDRVVPTISASVS
jgi:hypothetical protein